MRRHLVGSSGAHTNPPQAVVEAVVEGAVVNDPAFAEAFN